MTDVYNGEGRDLDWFAVDLHGRLAFFTTAGAAPLPRGWWPALAGAQANVGAMVSALPQVTEAMVGSQWLSGDLASGTPDPMIALKLGGWIDMAGRGIYTFDAVSPNAKPSPYLAVAYPKSPLRVTTLSGELQDALQQFVLPWLVFSELETIPPHLIYRGL